MKKRRAFSYLFFLFFYAASFSAASLPKPTHIIPPVIVLAKPAQFSLSGSPKTIISHQEIVDAGITTLAQALESFTGIEVNDLSGNNSQASFSIRGFGANASTNALWVIDGVPITKPDLYPLDLNLIPVNEIAWIEVTKGSEGVLYGDQAVGGVVHLITRKPIHDRTHFSCDAGSYHHYQCYASFSHLFKRFNLSNNITLLKHHTDHYRDHNQYEENRLLGNINGRYPFSSFNLSYNFVKESLEYPGALTQAEVSKNRRQANNHSDFFKDWNGLFHFNQKQIVFSQFKVETDGALSIMNGEGVLTSPFTQSRTTYFLKQAVQTLLNNNTLLAGFEIEADRYHLDSAFGITAENQQKYNLFTLASLPLTSRLTLKAGARLAELVSHLQSFTPMHQINRAWADTLGLLYTLSSNAHLYLREAGSFRFPKADENATAPHGVNGLKTQRGTSYETGIEFAKENYSGKINFYQLNLRDEIAFDPTQTPLEPFGSNRNLNPTQRYGMNVSLHYQILPPLTFDGEYDYVNARFQSGPNANKRIPLVAQHIFYAGLRYQIEPHLFLYTEAHYTGSEYPANDDANLSRQTSGYMLYHLNLRYEHHPISISFRIHNIFNTYYYTYTVLQQDVEYFYPAPGRNFILSLNYEVP